MPALAIAPENRRLRRPRRLLAVGAALSLCLGAAACSGGTSAGGSSRSGVLVVTTGSTGNFTPNFNPFSPNALQATHGMIYEPLFFFNSVKSGDVQPWLGKAYTWSDGGRTLKITIRSGATWSDGKPFTAADVAFSFQNAIDSPALNTYGLPLTSVSTTGTDGVTLEFSQSAYTKQYFILGKMDMLPEHIWKSIPDTQKSTVLNSKPVGTGAWTVKSVAGAVLTLDARTDYYMAGYPKFKQMRYLSFSGNNSTDAAITTGQTDWAGGFIPDIQKNYLAKNSKFALVDQPLAVDFFVPNDQQGPTADPNVRKAISAGLDRQFMNQSVYSGEAPVANPEALLLPNFSTDLDPSLAQATFPTGPAAVDGYLRASGYDKGSDGYYAKGGKRLTVTVKMVAGYTDYLSLGQLAQQELKKVGIDLRIDAEANATWSADQASGNFQMLLSNYGYTPDPQAYYAEMLDSRIAKPIGQETTGGNYGRYKNPTVDAALDRIAATTDPAQQKAGFFAIEQAFIKDMPLIPLLLAQDEQEFNGNHVTGYPTATDPYAGAAVWLAPDSGWVAMRLRPVAGSK